jgi:hypothetical protein
LALVVYLLLKNPYAGIVAFVFFLGSKQGNGVSLAVIIAIYGYKTKNFVLVGAGLLVFYLAGGGAI